LAQALRTYLAGLIIKVYQGETTSPKDTNHGLKGR